MGNEHYALLARNLGRIATSLETLVDLRRTELEAKEDDEKTALEELNDEVEAVLGAERNLYRELSEKEVETFRQWANDNYEAGEGVNPVWHPVVREECAKINIRKGLEERNRE
jgi:tRNA U55 pseudouridine synthase TruB|tara:strand:+ start:32126 stop:32464 length:339 start_codon:yes stop_codon:yes gene_type:complete